MGVQLLAYWLDQIVGDPPNRWHPVAWQGRFLAWAERHAPASEGRSQGSGVRDQGAADSEMARFAWGASSLLAGMSLSAAAAWGVMRLARCLPWPLRLLLEAGLLKLTLASHGLDRAAGEVEAALRRGDLPEARRLLSWHLVSRDTSDLSAEEVAGAAAESVAENLTDAFVAPLCAYAAGGLPAVWAYRFAQTADSMWGYHDAAHEWLGKPAARLDDALNWLPARLAAGLLTLAAASCGEDAANAWRTRRSQAGNTASPNAGQTMAAMAGALGVTLTKRGHYTLAGGAAAVTPDALARGRRITRVAAGLAVAAATIVVAVRWASRARHFASAWHVGQRRGRG
ncbi:MAG: cobalamin biosynthesis protein CobD [Chloroflexi bacterium HGW-Chloroflexi-1]|nr:MAG: cobalamin biosynthesis protein CobD [Chloroflexi bacterium HGW-Chloroflexi-1]